MSTIEDEGIMTSFRKWVKWQVSGILSYFKVMWLQVYNHKIKEFL